MSDIEKIVEFSQSVPNAVNTVYEDALQPSVKVVGTSLASVLEFLTIPVKGMQYVSDRAKLNLQHHLQTYSEQLNAVEEKNRCEVHPELGVPILQRLTYTTNAEIADLFTNLLLSASDVNTVADAHPAFISIIDRLSPDEAKIIQYISDKGFLLYCNVKFIENCKDNSSLKEKLSSRAFAVVCHWVTEVPNKVSLDFPDNCELYFANLISLGILVDNHGFKKTNMDDEYKLLLSESDIDEINAHLNKEIFERYEVENSFLEVTDLGNRFIKACCRL